MTAPKASAPAGERLAKRIARAGLCSRREAETWITAGRVSVNGSRIESPAVNVTEADAISVDGRPLKAAEPLRLWLYHKPAGLMTTHKDPEGRPTVFERLPNDMPRVISVGRLDMNSEGLLLLTTDGSLARKLELPSNGWIRRYRVRAYKPLSDEAVKALAQGVVIAGVHYDAIQVELERKQGQNLWYVVSLREGKNREIRKVFDHFGSQVNRLIRISYGPFQLGNLGRGELKEVPAKVIRSFVSL